ncbi:MAG: hypothetical protein ACYTFY_22705 [Planctomycetota bacterium]|jgi:hypothetical protein
MLKEITKIRQEGSGFRRWFQDENLELVVWYADETLQELKGFEFCYDKVNIEHALRITSDGFVSHTKIDSGDDNPTANKSPIHIPDGIIDKERILFSFKDNAAHLDEDLKNYVLAGIEEQL